MKKHIVKINIIYFFILLFISITSFNHVVGYEINYQLQPIENINGKTRYSYRKQIDAAYEEKEKYNKATKNADGWVYANETEANNETEHFEWNTYHRAFEYFHKNINSNYTLEAAAGQVQRYYLTETLNYTSKPQVQNEYVASVWNVLEETGLYQGIYSTKEAQASERNNRNYHLRLSDILKLSIGDIVIMKNNSYRYAVVDGVYITDNYLEDETINQIKEKFTEGETSKTLRIYNSAVLRTGSGNGKYYMNMDTAYKFWETTLRGNNSSGWSSSPTTASVKSQAANSFINYYDNTFDIPIESDEKHVYIRHRLADEGNRTLNPSEIIGQAIKVSDYRGSTPIFKEYKAEDEAKTGYTDYYRLTDTNSLYIFGNVQYTHSYYTSQTGSAKKDVQYIREATTWSNKINSEYECIGSAMGTGNNLTEATNNCNQNLGTNIQGNKWTNKLIAGYDQGEYVVIDFFYRKKPVEKQEDKKVYVRHIDLTDYDEKVNLENVNEAISRGKILDGTGVAKFYPFGESDTIAENLTQTGYQEGFMVANNIDLRILADNTDSNYICIGTNKTYSRTNLADAKSKLDERLSDELYDAPEEYVETGIENDIVVIDFYYSSNVEPPIERIKKGRLSFYTLKDETNPAILSGDDSYSANINNKVSNNDGNIIYDVIPSGEKLRMSVDNAYVYMLGAINIQQQKDKTGTINLLYTIYQPYTVYYKNWSASCSNGHTSSDKETGTCSKSVPNGTDDKGKPKYKSCGGTWSSSWSWAVADRNEKNMPFWFSIPYEVTYYKARNLRLYTISKIELLDGYSNSGLPLFDGRKHTINPTQEYKNIFTNATFNESACRGMIVGTTTSLGRTAENTEAEANTIKLSNIDLYYYNENGDDITTPTSMANSEVNELIYEKITTHSLAATIKGFEATEENASKYCGDENLKIKTAGKPIVGASAVAKIKLTNDQIYFVDTIPNTDKTIYIMGEDKNNTTLSRQAYETEKYATEEKSVVRIDLSKYTSSLTTNRGLESIGGIQGYKHSTANTIKTSTVYPKSIRGTSDNAEGSKYMPTSNVTTKEYFEEQALTIPKTRLNGKAYSFGNIQYKLITNNTKLNFDVTEEESKKDDFSWTRTNGKATFSDTEMGNKEGKVGGSSTTISPAAVADIKWEYGENNKTSKDIDVVNVFTPISFSTSVIANETSDNKYVDHTTSNLNVAGKQIQKNSRFTIEMQSTTANSEYASLNTNKYLKEYYISFNFDVQDVIITDAQASSGRRYFTGVVNSGTWIGPIYNSYSGVYDSDGKVQISAFALADANEAVGVVNQETNSYTVRAIAYNTPSSLAYDVSIGRLRIDDAIAVTTEENKFLGNDNNGQTHQVYYDRKNIIGHNNYVAEIKEKTENLNRVYDFKVTDLKDVDWKNIFRTSTSAVINKHTNKAYYSGIYRWNTYTTKTNEMLDRDSKEIGITKQFTLPLGPYKNTNAAYTKAPKLGYRFSFDLKTTGEYKNKNVVITPSFFYVSKEGNYIPRVKLFYKDSKNKYVGIENYKLYFVPDDGYRLTFEESEERYRFEPSPAFKKTTTYLGTASKITLTNQMMQIADNGFIQIWYGEYKLPNSTIAVALDDNDKYDIDSPLKDGYIGVKFNIEVHEYNGGTLKRVISYSRDNNNYDGNNMNTSQWDYEGYLGFTKENLGKTVNSLRIGLEKGVWHISNNELYNQIKGTVILYDTDAKASSDYD